MAERWGVIADDLTGACDAGVQFARHGFSTVVWLTPDPADDEQSEVIVLTTNSRRDPGPAARERTLAACRKLEALGARVIYKKIDSTFYGNPGPEIEAAMDACGFRVALVCPAFPAMGRTVEEGWLHASGWTAALHLSTRLREQGVGRVYELRRLDREQLGAIARSGGALVVLDAASREDLAQIAFGARQISPPALLAGSAGLAAEAASLLVREHPPRPGRPRLATRSSSPVLLFAGTTNPATLQQLRVLEEQGGAAGAHIVIPVDNSRPESLPDLDTLPAGALVLTGGDTALLVLHALSVTGIRLRGEILTGIPWGALLGGPLDGLAVATKAGGFGAPDALVRVVQFLSTLGNKPA